MNLALPIIIAFVLILPGVLLNYFYRRGSTWTSPVHIKSFGEEVAWGIFFALILHLAIMIILHLTVGLDFFSPILALLPQEAPDIPQKATLPQDVIDVAKKSITQVKHLSPFIHNPLLIIIGYLVLSNFTAIVVGSVIHSLIKWRKWDLLYPLLRFENHWHYMFYGDIRAFNIANRKGTKKKRLRDIKAVLTEVDYVKVRVIVEEPARLVEYVGRLVSYHFTSDGTLEHIRLENAYYFILNEDNVKTSTPPMVDPKSVGFVDHSSLYEVRKIRTQSSFLDIKHSNVRSLGVEHVEKFQLSLSVPQQKTNYDEEYNQSLQRLTATLNEIKTIYSTTLNRPHRETYQTNIFFKIYHLYSPKNRSPLK